MSNKRGAYKRKPKDLTDKKQPATPATQAELKAMDKICQGFYGFSQLVTWTTYSLFALLGVNRSIFLQFDAWSTAFRRRLSASEYSRERSTFLRLAEYRLLRSVLAIIGTYWFALSLRIKAYYEDTYEAHFNAANEICSCQKKTLDDLKVMLIELQKLQDDPGLWSAYSVNLTRQVKYSIEIIKKVNVKPPQKRSMRKYLHRSIEHFLLRAICFAAGILDENLPAPTRWIDGLSASLVRSMLGRSQNIPAARILAWVYISECVCGVQEHPTRARNALDKIYAQNGLKPVSKLLTEHFHRMRCTTDDAAPMSKLKKTCSGPAKKASRRPNNAHSHFGKPQIRSGYILTSRSYHQSKLQQMVDEQ
jgi:hypothetical protein